MDNKERNIVILDAYTTEPDYSCWEPLREYGNLTIYDRTAPDEIIPRIKDACAVLTNKVPFDAATMDAAPGLKYIGVLATGYNIIDIEAARERGITVTNVPAYSTDSVAQTVFSLLLELTNHTGMQSEAVKDGKWQNCPDFTFRLRPITELAGKTMGIIGFGNIGSRVAAIAHAFGMKVITSSGRETPEYVKKVSQEELFRTSDVVSLNTALTKENTGLINDDTLSIMKTSAFLINTARGGLVNEAALAKALAEGRIAGAGLDVLNQEPPRAGSPVLSAPNIVITPHVAWQSTEALGRLIRIATENLVNYFEGKASNTVS